MENYICITCGTQYPTSTNVPTHCPICEDDRQYVNEHGQQWITLSALQATHTNTCIDIDPGITAIKTTPKFAIGQHAHLIATPHGNVLCDCISLVDDTTIAEIKRRGGIEVITISHPHFYSSMLEWSRVFAAPILIHADNRPWVMHPDDAIQFWAGETQAVLPGVTAIRCGGHFPGSSVLHWAAGAAGKGALFTGDTITVVADRRYVTFMYSYPNHIPLNARSVRGIVDAVEPFAFDRLYGGWPGSIVAQDAKAAVRRSAERYIAHIQD